MNNTNTTLAIWQRLTRLPAGRWLFSRIVCFKAPYFSSIRPTFITVRRGYSELQIKKRRAVLNHIGTVHAIAICNMAELAAGVATDITIPSTHRWIPIGMTVEYLKKAHTHLRAVAELNEIPSYDKTIDIPVNVNVMDTENNTVLRAVITIRISPRK